MRPAPTHTRGRSYYVPEALDVRYVSKPLLNSDRLNDRSVLTAAAQHALNPARFERPVTRPGNVSIVSVPAGRETTKLPLSQISQSMTGYPPIAVAAGSNTHRQLWPKFGRSPHLRCILTRVALRSNRRPFQMSAMRMKLPVVAQLATDRSWPVARVQLNA